MNMFKMGYNQLPNCGTIVRVTMLLSLTLIAEPHQTNGKKTAITTQQNKQSVYVPEKIGLIIVTLFADSTCKRVIKTRNHLALGNNTAELNEMIYVMNKVINTLVKTAKTLPLKKTPLTAMASYKNILKLACDYKKTLINTAALLKAINVTNNNNLDFDVTELPNYSSESEFRRVELTGNEVSSGGGISVNFGASVNGGESNVAFGYYSTVCGGLTCTAWGDYSTVAGGLNNVATGTASTINGGCGNVAEGQCSSILGGKENSAAGYSSTAGGHFAHADHEGSFVRADSQDAIFSSTTDNQFSIRAAGGVYVSGNLTVTGNIDAASSSVAVKAFDIPHPDPSKIAGTRLRHCSVETPTAGDNVYRYAVEVKNGKATIDLPDYFPHLNSNVLVWVTPLDSFGNCYAQYANNQVTVYATQDGMYALLVFGTRIDPLATQSWQKTGVEYIKN